MEVRRRLGSKANMRHTVQRAIRRKRYHTHPTHHPDRYRPPQPTDQNAQEKNLTHALKKAPGSKKRKKAADREVNGDEHTTTNAATENGNTTNEPSSKPHIFFILRRKPKENRQNKRQEESHSSTSSNGNSTKQRHQKRLHRLANAQSPRRARNHQ